MAHHHGRRVHIAALNGGNVAQANLLPARPDGHGLQVFHRIELPLHPNLHHVQRRLHRARRLHRVLLTQLRQHLVHVQPHLGQALLRNLYKQLLVLRPKQFHLRHVRHAQELLTHVIGKGFNLGVAETVGLQGVDHAVHITKIVVKERPHHARWQGNAHVTHFFAHRVPHIGHIAGFAGVFDLKNNLRFAGLGVAANLVRKRRLLQRALDLGGDLLCHLLGCGTRPIGANHHGAKGEGRVFVLAQLKVGRQPQHHQHHHQIPGQRCMLQRPAREVKALFGFHL